MCKGGDLVGRYTCQCKIGKENSQVAVCPKGCRAWNSPSYPPGLEPSLLRLCGLSPFFFSGQDRLFILRIIYPWACPSGRAVSTILACAVTKLTHLANSQEELSQEAPTVYTGHRSGARLVSVSGQEPRGGCGFPMRPPTSPLWWHWWTERAFANTKMDPDWDFRLTWEPGGCPHYRKIPWAQQFPQQTAPRALLPTYCRRALPSQRA